MACPDEVAIDAVLSRTAAPRIDEDVRAHVATCEECLERWGACFELELWGGVLDDAPRASVARSVEPLRLQHLQHRRLARVAVAALLVAGALVAWPFARRSESPFFDGAANRTESIERSEVVELTMEYGENGPHGSWRVTTQQLPGSPARRFIVETSVRADGVVTKHERTELLPAALKEKGP